MLESAAKKVTSRNSVANRPLCLVYCNLNATAISGIHCGCARVSQGTFFTFLFAFFMRASENLQYISSRITEVQKYKTNYTGGKGRPCWCPGGQKWDLSPQPVLMEEHAGGRGGSWIDGRKRAGGRGGGAQEEEEDIGLMGGTWEEEEDAGLMGGGMWEEGDVGLMGGSARGRKGRTPEGVSERISTRDHPPS